MATVAFYSCLRTATSRKRISLCCIVVGFGISLIRVSQAPVDMEYCKVQKIRLLLSSVILPRVLSLRSTFVSLMDTPLLLLRTQTPLTPSPPCTLYRPISSPNFTNPLCLSSPPISRTLKLSQVRRIY